MKPPADGRECCGSSCKPCVMDMYGEELRVWKECWVLWEGSEGNESKGSKDDGGEVTSGNVVEVKRDKMPGSFEW